jgi:hypothetical protein
MTKQNVPFFALIISYLGTITNLMTDAKSIIGVFAAGASLVASLYAIAIARQRLKNMQQQNPFGVRPQPTRLKRRRASRRGRSGSDRLRKFAALLFLSVCLSSTTGCSHVATNRAHADKALTKSNDELAEQSRALTTAVVDSLAVAPQNPPTNLARRFAIADQEIEGLPLQRIPANAALAGDAHAAADIEARFTEINSLRAHNSQLAQALRERDAALMELGTKYEAERSKSLWRRFKTALIGTFGISGLIALCVFCPAVIPLLTRAVAWLVAKVPHLAGALGVVGKDAFDAVVKGVGQTRDLLKTVKSQDLKILDTNLRTETDRAHKELINVRRAALNV